MQGHLFSLYRTQLKIQIKVFLLPATNTSPEISHLFIFFKKGQQSKQFFLGVKASPGYLQMSKFLVRVSVAGGLMFNKRSDNCPSPSLGCVQSLLVLCSQGPTPGNQSLTARAGLWCLMSVASWWCQRDTRPAQRGHRFGRQKRERGLPSQVPLCLFKACLIAFAVMWMGSSNLASVSESGWRLGTHSGVC